MKISTRGRYALRIMIDLAEHNTDEYIKLIDLANRQEISEKYLESIISVLSKNGILIALRGKGGGYKLAKSPRMYTVGSILKLTEGSLAPIACLENKPNTCPRAAECKTLPMWEKLDKLIDDYLESVTIADLAYGKSGVDNYII
ncbi:MAG: Rrf2 family transcriptional regulator [Bacillota bacterium]|nr:Rrf2 family transcriptional regulator [Bacillota bacterium]